MRTSGKKREARNSNKWPPRPKGACHFILHEWCSKKQIPGTDRSYLNGPETPMFLERRAGGSVYVFIVRLQPNGRSDNLIVQGIAD
jgi:hypothetical protein